MDLGLKYEKNIGHIMLGLDEMPHISSSTNIHEALQAFLVAQICKYYYGELNVRMTSTQHVVRCNSKVTE